MGRGPDPADVPRRRTRRQRTGIPVHAPAPRSPRRRTRNLRPRGPPTARSVLPPIRQLPRHRPRWRRSTGPGRPRRRRRARPTRHPRPTIRPRPAGRWMPPRACRHWNVRPGLGPPPERLGQPRPSTLRSGSEPAWSPPATAPPATAPTGPSSDGPVAESSTATPPEVNAEPMSDTAPEGGAAIALPARGAVAALLLAGIGAELVRRRRQFQRHRRPGERMPTSGPGAQQVERAARTAGSEPGLDLLDAVLIQLAEEAADGGHALPDVRVVRVSAESVVLDLAAPTAGAIAPFVAADDTRWVLSPALLASELPDRARALAGLVTLGFSGSETVLLNLESVGTLAVAGPSEVTRDVLRGLAAESGLRPMQCPHRAHPVRRRADDLRGRRGRRHRGRARSGARSCHAEIGHG